MKNLESTKIRNMSAAELVSTFGRTLDQRTNSIITPAQRRAVQRLNKKEAK